MAVVRVAVLLLGAALAAAQQSTPIGKVQQLLTDLRAKVVAEGEKSKQTFEEFSKWSEARDRELGYEIKTGMSEIAALKATIGEQTATLSALAAKTEELSKSIAANEVDLAAATQVRANETATFLAEEKELLEVSDMLSRAIAVLQRELKKGKGNVSLVQLESAGNFAQAFGLMVQASMLSSADAGRLTALVQSNEEAEDADGDFGAPEPEVYVKRSGSIVETLEDLLDKAQTQLSEARKKEASTLHNFQLLKQSMEDEVKFAKKDVEATQTGISEATRTKSQTETDLTAAETELRADEEALKTLRKDTETRTLDYQEESKSRSEEIAAVDKAKQILAESTGAATGRVYGATALLQVSSNIASSADLAHFEAVRFIRGLARKQHSESLAQLATRLSATLRMGSSGGADPFAKVTELIKGLLKKLETEATAEETQKAYCDKEMKESTAKQEEKTGALSKLSAKVDQLTSRSAQLKEEVTLLQEALANLAKSQVEMEALRTQDKQNFQAAEPELEQGIKGVQMALTVLREFYSKAGKSNARSQGASTGIIGMLEVVESDFAKDLAELRSNEASAQEAFDRETRQNALDKTAKEQDVKYKTKEFTELDNTVAQVTSDKATVETEVAAINEYLEKIREQCIAKPMPYEERKKRREAEIAGLKEALQILSEQPALLQTSARRLLRGLHPHAALAA